MGSGGNGFHSMPMHSLAHTPTKDRHMPPHAGGGVVRGLSVFVVDQPRVSALVVTWLVTSLAALFLTKHVLHVHPVSEAAFTLCQFALSLAFGLAFTKGLRLHTLEVLTSRQLRMVVPLSVAFLTKELLKYASIARVSVNLINTIRSLAPVITIGLEVVFLKHAPPFSILLSMLPIVGGVTLTSADEMHAAGLAGQNFLVFLLGLSAAFASTIINQGQNMYSKILFGAHKIDPVSLQIYLSAISLLLLTPAFLLHALIGFLTSPSSVATFSLPSLDTAAFLVLTGFVNFVSSQLAFSTLSKISPVSYSVANTLKRVCIAVVAIVFFGERLSLINGTGIAISIVGVAYYERASRDYKAAKLYRQAPAPAPPSTPLSAREKQAAHAHPNPHSNPHPHANAARNLELPEEVAFDALENATVLARPADARGQVLSAPAHRGASVALSIPIGTGGDNSTVIKQMSATPSPGIVSLHATSHAVLHPVSMPPSQRRS